MMPKMLLRLSATLLMSVSCGLAQLTVPILLLDIRSRHGSMLSIAGNEAGSRPTSKPLIPHSPWMG